VLGADQGLGAAVDPAGNVIFVGFETVMSHGYNVWVRKVAPDSTVAWTASFAGAAASHDVAYAVAVDAVGSVVVVGYQTVSGTGRDIWVRKYDPDGGELWTTGHDGPESLDDEARGVAIDDAGDIVVAGFEGASAFPWRLWVRKYNSGGAEQWTQTHDGPAAQGAFADAVDVTADGTIVVAGAERDGGVDHVLVRKYGPDGTALWTTTVRGVDSSSHLGRAIAVDDGGRSYGAGGVDKGVDARDAWIGRLAP
jgi:hypothetical protein